MEAWLRDRPAPHSLLPSYAALAAVHIEAPEGEAPSKANVTRTLLAEQPRVTRVDIDWGEA